MRFDVKLRIIDHKIPLTFNVIDRKIPITFKHYQEGRIDVGIDPYEGPFEATPTDAVQVFQTGGKVMGNNFVVNPIPQKYGLITYDQTKTITIT